jgi:serine protease
MLAACAGGGVTPPPKEEPGAIAGRLRTADGSEAHMAGEAIAGRVLAADLPVTVSPAELIDVSSAPRLVPGELIVKFRSDALSTQAMQPIEVDGIALTAQKSLPVAGGFLYRATKLTEVQTLELAQQLSQRADIEYAEPNYIGYQSLIPNDTFYAFQWHYPVIGMPDAWDITTGVPIAVGVVDSGIDYVEGRPDLSHPDLAGVVLPGYDFVSDVRNSGDGDGWDPLPYHHGNDHGTHVAGTIAAATNNERGVAGINWAAKIVPVRVLGVNGSGTFLDIFQGILWSAGGRIPGVPMNPNPTPVINVSIGGQAPCTAYQQEILAEVFALGAIVVVSAGNENDDATRYTPANCPGVITVGATDAVNDRAPYSNYGPRIDIMAPGGDITVDKTGDGRPDGVLSLGFDPQQGSVYTYKQGTSMAAPHVAGVISLMKGLNANLTAEEALTIMRNTAIPMTPASCRRATRQDCGAGILNAYAAVRAVTPQGPPAAAGQTVIFNPNPVDFGNSGSQVALTLTNTTSSPVTYTISSLNWLPTNPTPFPEGAFFGDPLSATIPANSTATMTMGLDRSRLSADGDYAFEYVFDIAGQTVNVLGRFSQGVASGEPTGPTAVFSGLIDANDRLIEDDEGNVVLGGVAVYDAFLSNYSFEAAVGRHFVIAWVDENRNSELDEGDFLGFYPEYVSVASAQNRNNIDFGVGLLMQLGENDAADYADIARLIRQLR